jgi:N,N'-diacetyllegionaminate synthase
MTSREPIAIVAEAAQGFEGNGTQARLLVRAAARGGADLVKFQLVYADELAVQSYRWYELFRTLEMDAAAWAGVRDEAKRLGIGLAFDVYGARSLDEALSLGARAVKVHATDFFNHELIDAALDRADEVHLSLGGITVDELRESIARIGAARAKKLVVLSGFQAEPTPLESNHLARLTSLRAAIPNVRLGWMDHAEGGSDEAQWLGVLAVPFGITVLEKHITLSRPLELEDHVSALDPAAFAKYVGRIRAAERALGSDVLELTDDERGYRRRAVKAVVAREPIAKGAAVGAGQVMLKRAALDDAREPLQRLDSVIGRTATRAVGASEPMYTGDVA